MLFYSITLIPKFMLGIENWTVDPKVVEPEEARTLLYS